jgi:hypothetical protein
MRFAFENPSNGYVETVNNAGLWAFIFGPFYFIWRRQWFHALASFVLACVTAGICWFVIYPFIASRIMRNAYLRKGWRAVPYEVARV